jgi:hypothetical protein
VRMGKVGVRSSGRPSPCRRSRSPFRIVNIRARRRNPGYGRAFSAQPPEMSFTSGDRPGPRAHLCAAAPQPGSYAFDVPEIAGHGSAGSAILSCTILVPCVGARPRLSWSRRNPSRMGAGFDDSRLPARSTRMGFSADAELIHWGWYRPVAERWWSHRRPAAFRRGAKADRGSRARTSFVSRWGRRRQSPPVLPACAIGRGRPSRHWLPIQIEALRVRAVARSWNLPVGRVRGELGGDFRPWAPGKPPRPLPKRLQPCANITSGAAVELHLLTNCWYRSQSPGHRVHVARPTAHLTTNA